MFALLIHLVACISLKFVPSDREASMDSIRNDLGMYLA